MDALQVGLQQIVILFLLMTVGYVAMKTGIMNKAMQAGIARLVLNIGVPAAIIYQVSHTFRAEHLGNVLIVLAFSTIYHIVFFYGLNAAAPKFFPTFEKATLAASCMTFSNLMFIGIPVITNILGPESMIYIVAATIPFNILILSAVPSRLRRSIRKDIASAAGHTWTEGSAKPNLAKIFLTPINISVLVALLLVAFTIPLPRSLEATFNTLGAINTPLSLISIGSVLAERPIVDLFRKKDYFIISLLRCLIIPLLVFGALIGLPIDSYVSKVLLLLFAMPAAANNAMVAEIAGADFEYASMAVTQTTIFFFPALILLIKLLEYL